MTFSSQILFLLIISMGFSLSVRVYTKSDIYRLREEVREMFQHAYDSYLKYAYPYDELRPLSCDGVDTWGSYSLTLIDALDTLAIMGNHTEFRRVVKLLEQRQNFDADINVSVFETTIRIVGGLLSAHLLSYKTGVELEPGWPCNGKLLRLAEDVAQRLIPAFDTTTGMPYGTINLRTGVPPGETTITCTAAIGTFIIEFGTLSRLTGDPIYEELALNALKALYNHRSPIGLLGNHIDVMSGKWTAQDAGIGGAVDSYFEYLVKGAILFDRPELMSTFNEARQVLDKYLKKDDWYVWATMLRGQVTQPVFQSLDAYWPGVLSLIGETDTAMRTLHNYHSVWRQYGFTPEMYNLAAGEASREGYPLRPELIESIMYLYRSTRDPVLLQMGEDILRSIQHSARTPCGYATIKDVRDHTKENRMESFFLAETTKYLYLLFDPDNFIHNPGTTGKIINTPNGECVVDLGGYVFNTEAHPIDPAMLFCCHEAKNGINVSEVHRVYQILEEQDNIKFMNILEASSKKNATVKRTENKINVDVKKEITKPQFSENSKKKNDDIVNVVQIKTKAGYVNIDGTERDAHTNDSTSHAVKTLEDNIDNQSSKPVGRFDVDDIIVPELGKPIDPNSSSKSKNVFKLLPSVIQEFLNKDWKSKPKCEPQRVIERIRKEKRYPDHPDVNKYELLLTQAPAFLERISIAGEFLKKKT